MTTDFRALCVELTDCLEKSDWPHQYKSVFEQWIYIARAALAESEPEPPTDAEIMALMPQQMHEDLAAATRAMAEQAGTDSTRAKGAMRIILNRHVVDHARAVLACWGNHPAKPDTSLQPIPVSERPWEREKWCDEQGRCWWFDSADPCWVLDAPETCRYWASLALPAHALPLPNHE